MTRFCSSLLLCLLFALILLGASGCASTDPDNASARPWNTPTGWENGAMGGMYQQNH
jgi:hypothetical protein